MYNQSPGRMNMPKTGRGIPSALPMSPLNKFPVKPGMKLSSFENVLDKRTGKILSAEEQKSLLSSAPNTDLSQYEGITNVSSLISNPGESNIQGTANISNRVAGPTGRDRSFTGFQYPEVNNNVNRGLSKNEAGEITGFSYPNSKSNVAKTKRTEKQLQKMVQRRNQLSGDYPMLSNTLADGTQGAKNRIDEVKSFKTTSPSGENIYTTARVTGQQDNVSIPSVHTSQGTVGVTPGRRTTSNLTQSNKNFPQAFTQSEIQSRIEANPGRFYSEQGNLSNKIGNIGLGKNKADRYDHLDFTGSMQAPDISGSTTSRSGGIIKSQLSNEARRRGTRRDQVRRNY